MPEQLREIHEKLSYLREYLVKIGPERRKKETAYSKLREANAEYNKLQGIVTELNRKIEEERVSAESVERCKQLISDIHSIYSKIEGLLSKIDCSSQTTPDFDTMASPFDIRTAISLLPVMNGQEQVTQQLIDGILLYSSLITAETQSQLIDFILKTRLSASAKLRLKPTYSTVTDLVEDIRKFLLPKKSTEALQTQLFRARQGRRSIEAYGTELEELFVNLTIAQSDGDSTKYEILRPLNEKTAIKRFADGLSDPRLSTIVASRQFTSLPEAIRTALDENTMSEPYQERVMQFRPTATAPNRSHVNSTRDSRGRQFRNSTHHSNRNYNCNMNGNDRGHRTPVGNTSWRRGGGGHASRGSRGRPAPRHHPRLFHSARDEGASENLRNTAADENKFFRA